jgi:hypothetical protein
MKKIIGEKVILVQYSVSGKAAQDIFAKIFDRPIVPKLMNDYFKRGKATIQIERNREPHGDGTSNIYDIAETMFYLDDKNEITELTSHIEKFLQGRKRLFHYKKSAEIIKVHSLAGREEWLNEKHELFPSSYQVIKDIQV